MSERQTMPDRARAFWIRGAEFVLAGAFIAVFFWLTSRQYETFDLVAPDVARFSQAIWNTLRGRFLYSSIVGRSILSYHFSPFMALLAPLLLIWEDVRILFLAQTVAIAAAGLVLHRLLRREHAALAPWFLLAFYLNPALHEVALHELRRVTFAMPFLALAVYGLHTRRYRLLAAGLVVALLCKEEIALIVVMVGVYLLLFRRAWGWGLALVAGGLIWGIGATTWVIPAFSPAGSYPQMRYYAEWGGSPAAVVATMAQRPGEVLARLFDAAALRSLVRVFLPLGLILPLLRADVILPIVPSAALTMLSSSERMHRLEDWYMASLLPFLAGAVVMAAARLSRPDAVRYVGSLLCSALAGFLLFSQAPLGRGFDADRYRLTGHQGVAAALVDAVPPSGGVLAQDAFLTHLALRDRVYLFPWVREERPVDVYVLDRHLPSYPLSTEEVGWEIDNLVADPSLVVRLEGDGSYLLERDGRPLPGLDVDAVAEGSILLERVEVAAADPGGFYDPLAETPAAVAPGQTVRVTIYWRALDSPPGERTVSVRLMRDGAVLAQHDMQPSKGARPTSWWEPGWTFRDVYYLSLPPGTAAGRATLAVTLYDSFTQEPVAFEGGEVVLPLLPVEIDGG